jgi:hypothetical protein
MQNKIVIGILGLVLVANTFWVVLLTREVVRLEKQMRPALARQAVEDRQNALRGRFEKRMSQDEQKYTRDQLHEAEQLYQVANQKWGTPEAIASLQVMIKKYPGLDRTGCGLLYLAQMSKGDERARYLQDCIDNYNDCFYGDGVQVGAYARFLLAEDYKEAGETEKAKALYAEIKGNYADAVDHGGRLLVDSIKAD